MMWLVLAAHTSVGAAQASRKCACQAGQDLPLGLGRPLKQVCHALPLFLSSRLVLLALLGTMRLGKLQQRSYSVHLERRSAHHVTQPAELLSIGSDRIDAHVKITPERRKSTL